MIIFHFQNVKYSKPNFPIWENFARAQQTSWKKTYIPEKWSRNCQEITQTFLMGIRCSLRTIHTTSQSQNTYKTTTSNHHVLDRENKPEVYSSITILIGRAVEISLDYSSITSWSHSKHGQYITARTVFSDAGLQGHVGWRLRRKWATKNGSEG